MAVHELPGKTLGDKHRHYNELVKQAIKGDKHLQAGDFNTEHDDINNLIKIDVAAKKRNVEYILKVLQCEDMLYVSRAIKQSTWLVTDRQYSHIINPQYLHKQLFPEMTSTACAKLLLHIRLHLKDEKRVDDFYNFVVEKDIHAGLKWLPHCSIPLIVKEVEKPKERIEIHLLKRLCERSFSVFEAYIKTIDHGYANNLEKTMFLLNENAEKYLDIVETLPDYLFSGFGLKATRVLMKTCPLRILDKFSIYSERLHVPTFARNLKKEDIKDFITKLCQDKDMKNWLQFRNLRHFISNLPSEGRFDYLKRHFIDRPKAEDDYEMDDAVPYARCGMVKQCSQSMPLPSSANVYRWYCFAPFEVAFADLAKVIRAESAPAERIAMFGVLLSCAARNPHHVHTVLQYYSDKHINEPFKFKIQFVNMLLTKTEFYRFNEAAWTTLIKIFHSMEVYIESENNVQFCVEAIIVYKLLRNESIPEIIEKKFKFNSMKSFERKLKNDEEKGKVLNYLYKLLETKINNKTIKSEGELTETISLVEDMQSLLTDWKKNIIDYPWYLKKVQELIQLKTKNSWKCDLSTVYLKNKSWRRAMFNESLLLYPSDRTCYNALKHDPELMSRNKGTVDELRFDDNQSLRRVLKTLRVYWPQSLAAEWKTSYLDRLDKPDGHKALIRGLFTLAPRQQIIDISKKYAPSEVKINWREDDEFVLSLRKHIARNMYLSRPLPPADVVLLYAKGDYLQFALPSLNAVLHNMSAARTREHMTQLLDAPVSLQKHGIRLAFTKLESEELKKLLHDTWKKAKNPSIRAILFKQTYDLLRKTTKPTMIEEIWELLSIFIDNLSADENKIIYETLANFDDVPLLVKGKFFMKSFKFLKSLPAKANYESVVNNLLDKMEKIIVHLDPEFVADVLLESMDKKFTTERYQYTNLMAAYVLCSKDVETQTERYKKIIFPTLERSFVLCDVKHKGFYCVSQTVWDLLKNLSKYTQKYVFAKKMVFPTKLFSDIHKQLEKRLPVEKNYQIQTTWKLFTTFWEALEEHKETLNTISEGAEEDNKYNPFNYYNPGDVKTWNDVYIKAVSKFTGKCLQYLEEDTKKYFPSIYWLFSDCLEVALKHINHMVFLECLLSLLRDETFISSYLMVLKIISEYYNDGDEEHNKIKEVRRKIFSNPSAEIKLHYFQKYTRHDVDENDSCYNK